MHLPGPVRAAVGLIATAADEARNLPDRALELPMLAVSTALQASLRAQQRYARLAARGDEALARHRTGDEPPEWATFDEPLPADELDARRNDRAAKATAGDDSTAGDDAVATATDADPARTASDVLDSVFGPVEPSDGPVPPAKKAAAAKKTAAAKKAAVVRAAEAKKQPAVKKAPRPTGKTVSSPRHTTPSRFDTVDVPAEDTDAGPAD